jgi:hypothetical protein
MPNRHERRRAARMKAHENRFYETYIRHLPSLPANAPFKPGEVHHIVYFHDGWCCIYSGGACNCSPIIERRIEPRRS